MKTLALISSLLLSFSLYSQNAYVSIYDKETQEPLEFVYVAFQNASDSTIFLGNKMTDFQGKVLNDFNQDVKCMIRMIGYKDFDFILKKGEKKEIALEPYAFNLGDVVVTGQFTKMLVKDAIYDINSISNKNLEKKGANNLREGLNQELSITTNNGQANESAIMLNGMSGNYVKILIDGVPVEGTLNGTIDLEQINTINIEKIEILEGPATVEYGTNALAGAINIITKKTQNENFTFNLNTYYESVGKYNASIDVGFRIKNFTIKANGGRHFFNGFSFEKNTRLKEWKPREQYFAGLSLTKKIKHLKLFYKFDYFNELMTSRGALRAPYYTSAFDTYYKTNRITNKLILSGKLKKHHHIDISLSQAYYKRIRNIYFKDLTTLEQIASSSANDQDSTSYYNYLARAVYSFKKQPAKINFLLGTSFKHDIIKANRIQNKKQAKTNISFFGNLQYTPIKNLVIQPALRYGYNSMFTHPLLPSLSLKYDVNEHLTFRSSYARGFRAPSLKELFLEFHFNSTINLFGNENLDAENSHHFLLSADYLLIKDKHKYNLQAKFFYNRINEMIDLISISDIDWQYENIGNFDVLGIELKNQYAYKNLNLSLAYQLLGQKNSIATTTDFKDIFHFSHLASANLGIAVYKPKFTIHVDYKYIGEKTGVYITAENEIKNSKLASYQILDLSVNKQFWKERISVTAGIKNLLNYNTINLDGDLIGLSAGKDADKLNVLWGRTFFASLNFKW